MFCRIDERPGGGTDTGSSGRGGVLTRARPPATPGHNSSPSGAEKREESTGNSSHASPELKWWCGGRATTVKQRREWNSTAEAHKHGERERRVWGEPVGVAPFYRCGRVVRGGGGRQVKRGGMSLLYVGRYRVRVTPLMLLWPRLCKLHLFIL
jgi:hypothetical protein